MPTNAVPAQRAPDAAEVTVLTADGLVRRPGWLPAARRRRAGGKTSGRRRPGTAWIQQPAGVSLLAILAVQAALSLAARVEQHRVHRRSALPVGRAPRVGALAAWHADPPVPHLLLRRAGDLPADRAIADSLAAWRPPGTVPVFMLGATALLWATANGCTKAGRVLRRRLVGFPGADAQTGRFRHFDAMSLLLVALSAWCAVRAAKCGTSPAGSSHRPRPWSWLTPQRTPRHLRSRGGGHRLAGGKGAVHQAAEDARCLTRRICDLGANSSCLRRARVLLDGVSQTVLSRLTGTDTASAVLADAGRWTGPVCGRCTGRTADLRHTRANRRQRALLAVLACALLIVPLEQARIHTITSLDSTLTSAPGSRRSPLVTRPACSAASHPARARTAVTAAAAAALSSR